MGSSMGGTAKVTIRALKWHHVAGALVLGVFFFLLYMRVGGQETLLIGPTGPEAPAVPGGEGREVWMDILQGGRKIGYTHRSLFREDGAWRFVDTMVMRVNTMGVVQGLAISSRGRLKADLTLSSFAMDLSSNLFRFAARGEVRGRRLVLWAGPPGEMRRYDLVLKEAPYLGVSVLPAAWGAARGKGSASLSVFDPATLGVRPVKIKILGEETLQIGGKPLRLTKVAVDFMGSPQYAWVDRDGEIYREEGALGLALVRTTREEALRPLPEAPAADLTLAASVPVDGALPDPARLTVLTVAVEGVSSGNFLLGGGRQSWQGGLLTVRREDGAPPLPARGEAWEAKRFLRDTPFIQAEHPDIVAAVGRITKAADGEEEKARQIVRWVFENVAKRPVLSLSNAVETLHRRMGDCTEHAVLVAALGRAAGIPTAVETGLVHQGGRFYYHAWNSFYLASRGTWVTADAVMDQMPADVTHLRFQRGEAEDHLEIAALMGRLRLKIREAR